MWAALGWACPAREAAGGTPCSGAFGPWAARKVGALAVRGLAVEGRGAIGLPGVVLEVAEEGVGETGDLGQLSCRGRDEPGEDIAAAPHRSSSGSSSRQAPPSNHAVRIENARWRNVGETNLAGSISPTRCLEISSASGARVDFTALEENTRASISVRTRLESVSDSPVADGDEWCVESVVSVRLPPGPWRVFGHEITRAVLLRDHLWLPDIAFGLAESDRKLVGLCNGNGTSTWRTPSDFQIGFATPDWCMQIGKPC